MKLTFARYFRLAFGVGCILLSVAWGVAAPPLRPGDASSTPRVARNERRPEGEIRLPQAITLEGQVLLLQQAQVSALEAGMIASLEAHEGLMVEAGAELGRLDDARERLRRQHADYEAQGAKKKAENTIDLRYAQAAVDVSQAELDQAHEANLKVSGAIPAAEVRRRALGLERARLQVEQTQQDQGLNKITALAKQSTAELAAVELDRRKITAPVSGMVVDLVKNVGEWVKPGDPVLRILRIDRLRVEGRLSALEHGGELLGRPVTVTVTLPGDRVEHFTGKIVFISPEVEPVSKEFRIVAEVANRDLLLRPGMDAVVTIGR